MNQRLRQSLPRAVDFTLLLPKDLSATEPAKIESQMEVQIHFPRASSSTRTFRSG